MDSSKCRITVSSAKSLFTGGFSGPSTKDSVEPLLARQSLNLFLPIESKRSTIYLGESSSGLLLSDLTMSVESSPRISEDHDASATRVSWARGMNPLVTMEGCYDDMTHHPDTFVHRIRCSNAHDSVDKIFIYEQTEFVTDSSPGNCTT